MKLDSLTQHYQHRVTRLIDSYLPAEQILPTRLHQALRYSMQYGKRIRPMLVYATGEALGTPLEQLDLPALAVECAHVYSLIHDDLPAMDDDDMRRGQPSCHCYFDEATAILAGDALQSLAFDLLSRHDLPFQPQQQLAMIQQLATAIGSQGMAGGQMLDLTLENDITPEQLRQSHSMKTAALIQASVLIGAMSSVHFEQHAKALTDYGHAIGLAFQIQDDLFDQPQTDELNYAQLIGADKAQQEVTALFAKAEAALASIDAPTQILFELTQKLLVRQF